MNYKAATGKPHMLYDCEKARMTHKWDDHKVFLVWLTAEELANSIELVVSKIVYSDLPEWQEWRVLWCSCEFMGGRLDYENKHKQECKIPSKKTGCQCHLMIKRYLQMDVISNSQQI